MADGLSIAGLILAVPPIVELLVTYYADVKDAKTDIQRHATDLLSLKGIFEYIQSVQATKSDDVYKFETDDFLRLVKSTNDVLQALHLALQPETSLLGSIKQRVTWTRKQKEVQQLFERLERMKNGFVAVMMGDSLNYSQAILSELSQLKEDIAKDRKARDSETTENETTALLSWLAPVGPEPIHSKVKKAHQADTSAWFLNGPLNGFKKDVEQRARVLWVQGKSGSGKTFLLASATEHLKAEFATSSYVGLAHFYCSFDTLASQSPANIVSSLLAQLSANIPALYQELFDTYMPTVRKSLARSIDVETLVGMFQRHTAHLERNFVIVDAINESEMTDQVEQVLLELAKLCSNLRLLISSTNNRRQLWNDEPTVLLEQRFMTPQTVNEDIGRYVEHRIAENAALQIFSDGLRQDIRTTILGLANGVFRYTASQIDHVLDSVNAQLTGRDVRRALAEMPNDLNESYERILRQFTSESSRRKCYQKYMQRALLWLCFATRPLRLAELSEAIVIEDGDTDLDSDSRLRDPEILLSLGQGLFDYDRATGVVTLGHSSIKTFLTSECSRRSSVAEFALEELEAHRIIMRTCLAYLGFEYFAIEMSRSVHSYTVLDSEYPLLPYAARSWPLHIRMADTLCWSQISAFFETKETPTGGSYSFWLQYIAGGIPVNIVKRTAPLYYAASFGYDPLVSAILRFEKPLHIDQPGGWQGSTALQVACFRRQRRAAELLVEAGADPFALDGSNLSAVFWVQTNGWFDLEERMVKTGEARGYKPRRFQPDRSIKEMALELQNRTIEAERGPDSHTILRRNVAALGPSSDTGDRVAKERGGKPGHTYN